MWAASFSVNPSALDARHIVSILLDMDIDRCFFLPGRSVGHRRIHVVNAAYRIGVTKADARRSRAGGTVLIRVSVSVVDVDPPWVTTTKLIVSPGAAVVRVVSIVISSGNASSVDSPHATRAHIANAARNT